jgi:UDP-GlcNAc3NAcA epimerase
MKILTIVGARPQFIKAATVSRALSAFPELNEMIVHTGQHYDENMSEVFFRELDIPEPAVNLGIGSGTHAWQTGSMLKAIEEVLMKEHPDRVMVYGDTNSTLAGALAAVKLHIPVAHVEAGLRSFNMRMPEEINRIATDRISGLLFAPTPTAMENLEHEGLKKVSVFTGDVMYDSILFYKDHLLSEPGKYVSAVPEKPYYLATIHRAENTDDPDHLKKILQAFKEIPGKIILPVHPRTRKLIGSVVKAPSNLVITEPAGYLDMISMMLHAEKILTDSGGLQKEAYFLGKPCITLRTETEWLETLHGGWNTVTGTDPDGILSAVYLPPPSEDRKNAFGNGHAAEKIARILFESSK